MSCYTRSVLFCPELLCWFGRSLPLCEVGSLFLLPLVPVALPATVCSFHSDCLCFTPDLAFFFLSVLLLLSLQSSQPTLVDFVSAGFTSWRIFHCIIYCAASPGFMTTFGTAPTALISWPHPRFRSAPLSLFHPALSWPLLACPVRFQEAFRGGHKFPAPSLAHFFCYSFSCHLPFW